MSLRFNNPGLPGQPLELVRKQPTVRLYFVATQLMNKQEDGTFTSPLISAGGHGAMQMPPIGEFLDVPANVGQILINQTKTFDRKGNEVPGMTADKTYAELVRQSFEQNKPIEQVVAQKAAVNLTDEQLLDLIKERNIKVPVYQDGKEVRSEQTPTGENLYQDDVDGEDNADEVKYQDDVDAEGQPVAEKKSGRRTKKDAE
jgi:hypothetical protein